MAGLGGWYQSKDISDPKEMDSKVSLFKTCVGLMSPFERSRWLFLHCFTRSEGCAAGDDVSMDLLCLWSKFFKFHESNAKKARNLDFQLFQKK